MSIVPALDLISTGLESRSVPDQVQFLRELLFLTAAGLVAREGAPAAFEDISRTADAVVRQLV